MNQVDTGKCMPDSSIMLELCNILDITVNELLSGERIEMNHYEEKVNELFSIGTILSIISLVFLWIIYVLYDRLKERKLLATGITFLFAIPFTLLINITLAKMIEAPAIDIWDILSRFILLTIAVAFIIGDYAIVYFLFRKVLALAS